MNLSVVPPLYDLPGFYEPFSAISHLFGAVFFLYLGSLLIRKGWGDRSRVAYLSVYAIACTLLLSMSGVYHMMVRATTVRAVMERLDHGAIFILIAGTFTPAHGILFRGWLRWGVLLVIWTLAIVGITLKTIFFAELPEWMGLSFYLGLGWIGLLSMIVLAKRYGFSFVKPLVWGAIAYTLGAVFEFLRWFVIIPGVIHSHEIFHLAVLAGALFHWWFIWQFADGRPSVHRVPQLNVEPEN